MSKKNRDLTNKNQSSRANILARLREVQHSRLSRKLPSPPPQHCASSSNNIELLVKRFEENRIEVYRCQHSNWPEKLSKLANEKGLANWMLGNNQKSPHVVAATKALAEQSKQITHFDQPYEELKDKLFNEIDAGFTRAEIAIIDTGTIVLVPDENEPRTLSLVPPVHIILLDAKHIFAQLREFIESPIWPGKNAADTMPTNLLLISSPSKTADIQQTLAYGAHGPKELIVLLVES